MVNLFPKQPLSMIANVERGKFSPRPRNDPQYYGGATPFIQTGDIARAGRTIVSWSQTLNEKGLRVSRLFPKGTILMSIAANIGDVAISSFETACPDSVVALVPRNGTDHEWLFQTLRFSKPSLASLATQNAQANLSLEKISPFEVSVPSLPEQRKIAEILRTWDEAIEAATKLVTALNARREALRTTLVTEADIRGRPTVFGEFLKESRVRGSDGASARKITVKLYGKGAVPKSDKRDGSTKTRYYRRSPGQLIYSKLDFLNGAFALVPESLQGYESSLDLPAFDISEHVNSKWLIEYLTRPAYYTAQLHLARGQRKARRIAPDDFLASPVKLPQRDRQDEIAEVLAVADREIALRETELDTLVRQKRGLMQKLLTGEWRVGRLTGLSTNDEI